MGWLLGGHTLVMISCDKCEGGRMSVVMIMVHYLWSDFF